MAKQIVARKLDILKFIMNNKLVWIYQFEEEFGFSRNYARVLLSRLKRAGLVINMTRGCWELTEEGYRKLRYYDTIKDKEEQEV